MNAQLQELEPKRVLSEFYKLCSMPHGSGNITQISNYLMDWAKEHQIEAIQEPCGNVIMRKPGTPGYENKPVVVIQGHMDMVAVKDSGVVKNMETDGLDLETDGNYLYAKGTSLGGDDGIAVAYALAILASDDIPHPPIELLATVNEETGMDGAMEFDQSHLNGRILLNIDSEDEGIFLTGCAGGASMHIHAPIARVAEVSGSTLSVRLYGLKGGHSGCEIHKGHADAILELAALLGATLANAAFSIVSITGGEKDNAIPMDATAIITCETGSEDAVMEALQDSFDLLAGELIEREPKMRFMVAKVSDTEIPAMTTESTAGVIKLLCSLPFGVKTMSEDLPGIVETSNNVGICRTEKDTLELSLSVRSMKESEKNVLCDEIIEIAKSFAAMTERSSEYPGWSYRPESPLRDLMVKVYTEMYGEPPVLQAIHAGLECGLLIEKLPDLDCVSFGPNILDIHTTKERLDLASTKRVWEYLVKLLGAF